MCFCSLSATKEKMEKYYECRKCKKMTYSTPNINDWLCLECRSLQLRMVYEEKRVKTLTKKELAIEVRKLREKCNKIFEEEPHESDYSDNISSEDQEKDDYIPPTPAKKNPVKRKIFQKSSNTEEQHDDCSKTNSNKEPNVAETLASDSSHSSESSSHTPTKVIKRKLPQIRVNFKKNYKGPKRYIPGTGFSYKFENVENKEARDYLVGKLREKQKSIKVELNELFKGKRYDISGPKKKYPCIVDRNCEFLGNKLSRHYKSKLHKTTEKQGKFLESFFSHSVQYITIVDKSGTRKPILCEMCERFFERMTSHLQHHHQLVPGTAKFVQMLERNTARTQEFLDLLYPGDDVTEEDDDEVEETQEPAPKKQKPQAESIEESIEDSQSINEKAARKEKNRDSHLENKDAARKNKDRQQVKKDKKSPQMKSSEKFKMLKSSSTEVRLRGRFTKVTPSKHKKEKVFSNKLPVTKEIQMQYQLEDNEFRYYYKSSNEVLLDYGQFIERYCNRTHKTAEQYVLDIRDIWSEIDQDMTLNPNQLRDEENLESRFYLPQKQLLLDNKDKDPEDQDAHIQANTIRSKLISLNRFLRTLTQRSIYIGLKNREVEKLYGMISQCKLNLKELIKEREQTIKEFKSNVLLNSSDIRKYGDSNHLIKVTKLFESLGNNGEEQHISLYDATDLRNYLMVVLALVNCLRASNLINITLYDVENAVKDKTVSEAYLIRNKKYKVSIIYGAKLLMLSKDTYKQLQSYIKYVRPKFITDNHRSKRDRYVFVSSRADEKVSIKPEPMSHSVVTKCLSRSFEKAEVFPDKKHYSRVSCCRIRFSIITELVSLGTEELETIAHCFAKHDKKTCRRFYVQFWNNREAVRLSWKCQNMLKPLSENERKAVEQRETTLAKSSIPSTSQIKKWYETKRNLIKVTSKLDARDEGLENMIQSYSNERLLRDDGM